MGHDRQEQQLHTPQPKGNSVKDVTYRGTAHRARITEDNWSSHNISSKDVEWNGYGDTKSIANEAADWLAEHDDRFEVKGAGDDSAYGRRLRVDTTEQINRERVGTVGGVAPEGTTTRARTGTTEGTTEGAES